MLLNRISKEPVIAKDNVCVMGKATFYRRPIDKDGDFQGLRPDFLIGHSFTLRVCYTPSYEGRLLQTEYTGPEGF
jgi:hypothetical protein